MKTVNDSMWSPANLLQRHNRHLLKEAKRDWATKRAYIDNHGNFRYSKRLRYKGEAELAGKVTPWNRAAKQAGGIATLQGAL